MAANGALSNDCGTAPLYRLVNGSLSVVSDGVTYTYSTNAGVGSQQFLASAGPVGGITTTFSIDGNGKVAWRNPAFYGGQAQFCSLSNGNIYAIFTYLAQPSGCAIVQLTLFAATTCSTLQAQVNNIAARLSSLQLNTVTVDRPTTVLQRIVSTAIVVSTEVSTYTPPAQTQTATRVLTSTAIATTIRVVTATATATVQAVLPAPAVCSNQGLQYGVFVNNQPNHVNQVYTAYDPTYMKNRAAANSNSTWTTIYYTSVLSNIGGGTNTCANGNGNITLYSNAPISIPCQQFSAMYRGYLYIYSSGTWTFSVSGVDDYFGLWLGSFAQVGWTKSNANISLAFSYTTGGPALSISGQFTAGQYLPIRVVHGQSVGGFGYTLSVTDPNGLIAQVTGSSANNYLVQFGCNTDIGAPNWGAFGYEY